ncbi:MAG: hypothetical protein ACKVH8_14410 [Pirellulales bacterium]
MATTYTNLLYHIGFSTKLREPLITKGLQAEHHKERSFKDEFLDLLRKHKIELDERYVWD